ncbi:type I polyketide synthase [Streptosporangium longisporum]|uniref:Uncharacterized protein n=1 Tax=Streptosporangium longisporum TaxID=46187 RepID=A0ABN3XPQ8_9ACTN
MSSNDQQVSPPIAVIGTACRLPGAPDPRAFWRLLDEGRGAVREVPAHRDPSSVLAGLARENPGALHGGYLDDIGGFDPEFFGISPREAAAMDPQQRLVLELAWEALEDAGLVPATLSGSATGVFVGSIADEYAALSRASAIGRHTLTGTTRAIIANRVSYALGLRGPSIAVDTAQSSSLVAVHLAVESLRRGESRLALAGGVNLIVDPAGTAAVARFGGLSPDGHCHTFDRRANGYVRGEGAGLVLLKPLDAAIEDGDRVHAVLLGSAVNNDGTTDGLTVPSAHAQAEVIRTAWAAAGVTPSDVQYVELHGTGTRVGDPVEARGLGLARDGGPVLHVGSVKTNIGHLEGAAGIAGLLKTVLSVGERRLPASLNYSEPNPDIDLDAWRLAVRDRGGAWPREDERLVAGVSSFGMGGTNCHIVVAEAPGPYGRPGVSGPAGTPDARAPRVPLVLSARTEPALREQAARLRDLVAEHGEVPAGVPRSLATTRTAFEWRAAVTGDERVGLEALADGRPAAGVVTGRAVSAPVAVLFPGQGSQRPGMGRRAYQDLPVWRSAFDEVAAALDERLPRPVGDVVWAGPDSAEARLLDRTAFTQPAIFAVEVATFRLLASLGVEPSFLAGHSIGEVAAAHVSGILDLPSAAELIVARGRLMEALPAGGGMLAVGAGEAEAAELVALAGGTAVIAAVNGPESVVVAGGTDALEEVAALATARGHRTRLLPVSHAFHSPLMEPMLDDFREALAGIAFGRPRIPFVSTVTGELVESTGPEYWVEHARRPVRFADGLARLRELGAGIFVEAGPGATLSALGREAQGGGAVFVPVLGRHDEVEVAVGRLFTSGVPLDWDAVFPPGGPRAVLPTYPFQREHHWLDAVPAREPVAAEDLAPGRKSVPVVPAVPAVPAVPTVPDGAAEVERRVLDEVAAVLGFSDPARVDRDATFKDLGLDSLGMVELRDRVGTALGVGLPAAALFGHPTVAALARHLSGGTVPDAPVATAGHDDDPVVIVGMGCRFPGGVTSPEELWELVVSGTDAIGEFPADRGWDLEALYDPDPQRPGTSYTRHGGFLRDAGEFDAAFFGMSPREALATDPQQRLLLQVVWEALERAGIDPLSLRESDTGVFVGATASDYTPRLHEGDGASDGYLLTGGSISVASGRIAYVLGSRGPALTVDTACSSSLVALDLAVRSVRSGECSLALAGGVAVMASPGMFVEFSRQRGLSPDGRCRAFGAGADGTGWAEGVGVVAVERLSRARQLGHRVLAVVAGSAINQDGASNGLTAPNGRAQEQVIARALAEAGVNAVEVDAVEAHGTGTRLGDPIEAQALIAAYGRHRQRTTPLWLGSLKSNIGHAQAAAGVGGVIKMVMALRHGLLPATLHAHEASPLVDWHTSGVRLLQQATTWPQRERGGPRRAGVSSFGISGTNAHLILQQAPDAVAHVPADPGTRDVPDRTDAPADADADADSGTRDAPGRADRPPAASAPPVLLSGDGPTALRRQAAALADHLEAHPALDIRDVAVTLTSRARLGHGAAVLAGHLAEHLPALRALARGELHDALVTGERIPGRTVFVFPGQGSQWPEMARALLDSDPVFRAEIDACARAFARHTDWSLTAVLRGDAGAPPLERVDVVQPVLFAVMVSLAAMWRAAGVRPDAVVGHSQGEIAAAYVAGALSLADAARIVTLRSAAIARIAGNGGMVSVALGADELAEVLARRPGEIEIAVRNGPRSTVVAGGADALDELLAWCDEQSVRARRVPVDYASHTRYVEPLRDELLETFAGLRPRPAEIAFHSSVTGERMDTTGLDAGYWYHNLRRTVEFEAAVNGLIDTGHHRFIEIGPHPVLTMAVEEILAGRGVPGLAAGTLRRGEGGTDAFRRALAVACLGGVPVSWTTAGTRAVDLPTYRFERERYWLTPSTGPGRAPGLGRSAVRHPLLGAMVALVDGGAVLTGRLDTAAQEWLTDHSVFGTVLAPGTVLAELAARAGDLVGLPEVRELTVQAPLVLTPGRPATLQVLVSAPDEHGHRTVEVHARSSEDAPWTRHAAGTLGPGTLEAARVAWPPPGAESIDVTDVYTRLYRLGYDYGPAFQGLAAVWRTGDSGGGGAHGGGTVYAELVTAGPQGAAGGDFVLHPALLDAALHPVVAGLAGLTGPADPDPERPLLPFAFEGLRLTGGAARAEERLRARIKPLGGSRFRYTFADEDGEVVGAVDSLAFRPAARAELSAARPAAEAYRIGWERPARTGPAPGNVVVLGGFGDVDGPDALVTAGGDVTVVNGLPEAIGAGAVLVPVGGRPGDVPANGRSDDVPADDRPGDVPVGGRAGDVVARAHERTAAVLGLLQEWLRDPAFDGARLSVVVDGSDLASAPVRGLVRTAAAEHPGRFALVVVDGPAPASLLATEHGEREVAVRDGELLVPRLAACDLGGDAPSAPDSPEGTPAGTVLITGGTGTLGALVARRLAASAHPPHLLLVSRSGPHAPGAQALAGELGAAGAGVTVAACDVTDRAAVAELLASIPSGRPLRSVVHTAGLLADATVTGMTTEELDAALRPKVDAAWHLHELTEGLPLEGFVLFSSAVATFGVPGQANYAAANAFLDALAEHRHRAGLPATAVAWGLWEETSAMTSHLGAADRARLARYGVGPVETGRALDALERIREAHTVVSSLDEGVLRDEAAAGRLPALFSTIVRPPAAARRPATGGAWALKLRSEPPHERLRTVTGLVREQAAAVLGQGDADGVGADRPLKELGFDSLTAVELRNRLNALTGLTLPATVAFEFPTVAALASHLLDALSAQQSTAATAVTGTGTAGAAGTEADDPVVIVGMGCRFPGGVTSPEELWELVVSGTDAIGDFPADRGWDLDALYHPDPDHKGTSYTRHGGFLRDAGEFDAAFFGMSPREALATDPQQRLLLQVAWEALERAGIDPLSLRESDTGVFVGAMYDDYAARLRTAPEDLEGMLLAGNESSVASGRIAYVLGSRGPALTVDTACSSSLVALDLAVRSVRSGECSLALAGGVAVMASPGMFVEFSRQRGLSPDGRCRAFGAGADGTGWAEGVGVVAVERLSRARTLGHRVLAVVAGSAINQDGASNGLTAPNGRAQEQVIARALAEAAVNADEVDAVEAHGTGTRLGDPIEAQALIAAYGRHGQRTTPLWLGSLKSNIGHAQAAAGVGGVIKMVMALRHGLLPATLHAHEASPLVDWHTSGVRLLQEAVTWPERDDNGPRRAGVSSFGISGTNAHLILQQAPADPEPGDVPDGRGPVPLVLSAKTATALRAQAGALHDALASGTAPGLRDIGLTLARRPRFEHRAVIDADAAANADTDAEGGNAAVALAALAAIRDGGRHPRVESGRARPDQRLAFLFSGQGSQRAGMGAELLETSAPYAEAFDEISASMEPLLGVGLRELVTGDPDALRHTRYAQPALFALEVALYRLAESHGLRPDFLIGHSVGELAAAHVAGVLDLADACALVAARGRLMQSARDGGAMAAFAATEAEAAELAATSDGRVEIAAVNGPAATVLSGDADEIDRLVGRWKDAGHRAARLKVGHAFHSAHMDGVLDEFRRVVSGLSFHAPRVPVVSTVTGALAGEREMSEPDYWVAQLRGTVRFADAVRAAHRSGVTRFAELGPDGSLAAMARESADEVLAVPLLRPGRPEAATVRAALGRLHAAGVPVDFGPLLAGGRLVDLPTYPFETRHYWLLPAEDDGRPSAYGLDASPHPLLTASTELPGGARLFTGALSARRQPWLAEHRVDGRVLVPAAALAELALSIGAGVGLPVLGDFVMHAPLELDGVAETRLQVSVSATGELTLRGRAAGAEWTSHVTAVLTADAATDVTGEVTPGRTAPPPPGSGTRLDADGPEAAYRLLAEHGYEYGPAFQGLRGAWPDGTDLHAEAELPAPLQREAIRYGLHPALLDAVLHAISLHAISLHGIDGPAGVRRVPYALDGVRLHAAHATRVRARLTPVDPADPDAYRVELTGDDGRAVLTVERLRLRPLPSAAGLYRLRWEAVEPPAPVAGDVTVATSLPERLAGTERSASTERPAGTVLLALPDDGDDPYAVVEAARRAVRRWLAETDGGRLVFLTRGLAIGDAETALPSTAALWGLVRAARAEHPGRFALLDTDDDTDPALLAAIGAELPEAALRDGVPRVPRLSPEPPPTPEPAPAPAPAPGSETEAGAGAGVVADVVAGAAADGTAWPRSAAGGTVLITGGLGALGRRIARHLVTRHGVRDLLLVSRRGEEHPDAAHAQTELTGLGARVTVRACDPSDRDALAALLAGLDTPLTGVVHAAGVVEDAAADRLSAGALRRTIEAKAVAAENLDEATRDAGLDAFVLFGSVAGVVGTAGQGGYCAANAALEAITHRRRLSGGHGVTVHWGLWDIGAGMGAALTGRDVARLGRAGIRPMGESDGIALFDRALRLDTAAVVAAHLDPRAAERHRTRAAVRHAPAPDTATAPNAPAATAPNTSRVVLEAVAAVLGHASGAEVDPERSFSDLGFDSLTAVELRNRLSEELGVRLPGTIVFDHPDPVALIRFLDEVTGTGTPPEPRDEPREPAAPGGTDDAIAIVGMACRFPGGVRTPAELWELLDSGGDAISAFPDDRGWDPDLFDPDPERSGTSSTRYGGFLHDAAEFDPGFFGISPREALAVDPQQRLLLQAAWEAVEDAGIDPSTLRGTRSGVFVGVMYSDYGARVHQRRGTGGDLEGYLVSGSAGSVASGRISFTLGLEGPAVTVDTACSSSLVAVHQAAQALRLGECTLALAGGVTVMASPATFIEFSRQRGLAPDGRCKPFSADADGTAWGEGVGLLVLERLSDARRNGHRVLAVVRGSAVNQDGASNGLTAPNGPSQERVIRGALRSAGLRPADVDVLEAHGTGTRLGDPIEAGAVLNTYGRDRGDRSPLLMGSVKSNIGHTQAAAGVAGIIKMVLAMRYGRVPATLHRGTLTGHVDWSGGTVSVPAEPVAWPDTPGPRRAAVSSFGISGTNAHVVLESGEHVPAPGGATPDATSGAVPGAAPEGTPGSTAGAVVPWVLSARDAAGLREQAVRLRRHVLADPGLRAVDVALSLGTTRTAFERRAVVLGRDRDELLAGLGHLIDGTATPSGSLPAVLTGTPVRGGTAVLFTGQGSQRTGMGTELYRSFPVYARAFDEVCAEFRRVDGTDVAGVVAGDAGAGPIDQTRYTQAALFAVEVALFRLLESWGLPADLLAGHSIGEITAAHVGGALSLPDAVALVASRGRLMQELPAGGAMTAVQADLATVERLIAETGTRVDVAAVNAPGSVVLSGDAGAVGDLAGVLAGSGYRTRPLAVSHAFHSAHMEPMLAAFREEVGDLPAGPPARTVVSTLTAREAGADTFGSAAHWADQVRGTVRFADAVGRMRELGAARFLEVGPDAALTAMVGQHELGEGVVAIPALDRRLDDAFALWSFVARAFVAGVAWDWRALLRAGTGNTENTQGGGDAVVVPLPTYPFHRERLWLLPPAEDGSAAGIGAEDPGHPLLSASIAVPDGGQTLYTGVLSQRRQPWLAEHALAGTPVLPATALVDLLGWLAERHGMTTVRELTLHAPVTVGAEEEVRLRVTVADDTVRVHARPGREAADAEWTLHAEAVLGTEAGTEAGTDAPAWSGHRPPEARPVDVTGIYATFAGRGYDYGPAFQGLRALWTTGDELHAEVDTAGDLVPGLLDAALHAWIADAGEAAPGGVQVPHTWREVRVHDQPRGPLRVRIRHTGEETFTLDVVSAAGAPGVLGSGGGDGGVGVGDVARPVLSAGEVRVRRVEESALLRGGGSAARPYELAWVPAHLAATAPAGEGSGGQKDTIVLVRGDGQDLPFPTVPYGGEQDGQDPAAVRALLLAVRESILTLPERAHLVVVTRGAVAVDAEDRVPGLAEAALWGLVRAARQEYPGRISIVDVDGHGESSALLPRAVAARPGELAIRRGEAFRPRLRAVTGTPATRPDPTKPAEPTEPTELAELGTGTVLVSGAGGALGAAVVRHLVARHGARDLLLVSRRGDADPVLRALAGELGDRARVRTAACDLADAAATEALLAGIGPDRPLGAVFHIAGALDDAVLENTTGERLERVLRPKVDAAWNLHRLTAGLPLTAFVLFSSVAGVLGNAGQAGYAAANAFLDALACHRRAAGLPGTSLAWGLWESGPDTGMAAGLDTAARARLDRLGIRALPVDAGLDLLDRSLASGPAVVVPVWFDRAALARRQDDLPEVLGGLVPARPATAAVPLARRLPGMDEAAARTVVRDTVAGRVAEVLGLAGAAQVPEDRGLFDLGLDSLTAIELRNRLGTEIGERLPATVLFDHPTVRALTEHLLERRDAERPAFDTAALETWVSSASDLDPGHRRRADLVRALRAALNTLDAGGTAVNGEEPLFGMDSASDDELFGLLDRELSD